MEMFATLLSDGASTALGSAANGGWTTTTTPAGSSPFDMLAGGNADAKGAQSIMARADKDGGEAAPGVPRAKPPQVDLTRLMQIIQQRQQLGT